jgi:hypothetical protein
MSHEPSADPGINDEPDRSPDALRPVDRLLDAIAYSSVVPSAIAGSLVLAAASALAGGRREYDLEQALGALLAVCGAIVVYGLDRLRDTDRDRRTSPRRTAFVERNARALATLVGVATIGVGITLALLPLRVAALALTVGLVGLLHRRLKIWAAIKTLYVSAAWVAIGVGIPWLIRGGEGVAWLVSIYFASLTANLIASNLRDDEAQLLQGRPGSVLAVARLCAAMGLVLALAAPAAQQPLLWIPLCELAALVGYRASERYGHLAVDGALLVGAGLSLIHFSLGTAVGPVAP